MAYRIITYISINIKHTYMVKIHTSCKCLSCLQYNIHICPWFISKCVLCFTIRIRHYTTLHNLLENVWEAKHSTHCVCKHNHLSRSIVGIKTILNTLQPWHTNTSNNSKSLISRIEKWYSYIITRCLIANCHDILIIKHNCVSI